jgi:multiple sugar transport system substrate-binding protein
VSRRRSYGGALLMAGALAFTAACAGDDGGSGGGEAGDQQVTLRFSWWGNDTRHELTERAIALFEDKNPGIKVDAEPSDWDSYYDRLTTQIASRDTPDLFAVEIRRLGEFAGNGILGNLDGAVDTSDLNPNVLGSGVVDGVQYAIPTGANAFTVTANTKVLADAGVALPDDATWTWEDYFSLSAQVTDATDGGTYGTQLNFNDAHLRIYAAQRGEQLYGESDLAVSEETLTDWYQMTLDAIEQGATPDAARSTEIGSTGIETSLVATNTGAFGMWWSNQLSAISSGSGEEIELLRLPRVPGAATGGTFLQPTMFWTTSSSTKHPEEAAKLIDFLVNDPEAAEILGSDRGLPMNRTVLEQVRDDMPPADVASLEFIEALGDDLAAAPTAPPSGAGDIPDMLERYGEEVIFGRMSPQKAAQALIKEANATLG